MTAKILILVLVVVLSLSTVIRTSGRMARNGFSKSGILMSPLRSRMSSKTLEMRTFLKSNYGFVDNPAPVAKTVEISSKQ